MVWRVCETALLRCYVTLKLLLVVEGLEGFNVALGVAEVVSHLKKNIFF